MPNHHQPLSDSILSFASVIGFVINFIADVFALALVLVPIVLLASIYYDQALFNDLTQAVISKNWTGIRFMIEALGRVAVIIASWMVVIRRVCFGVSNGYASGVVPAATAACATKHFYDKSMSEIKNQ